MDQNRITLTGRADTDPSPAADGCVTFRVSTPEGLAATVVADPALAAPVTAGQPLHIQGRLRTTIDRIDGLPAVSEWHIEAERVSPALAG